MATALTLTSCRFSANEALKEARWAIKTAEELFVRLPQCNGQQRLASELLALKATMDQLQVFQQSVGDVVGLYEQLEKPMVDFMHLVDCMGDYYSSAEMHSINTLAIKWLRSSLACLEVMVAYLCLGSSLGSPAEPRVREPTG